MHFMEDVLISIVRIMVQRDIAIEVGQIVKIYAQDNIVSLQILIRIFFGRLFNRSTKQLVKE